MKFLSIRSLLLNSALLLLIAGTATLFIPYAFFEANGSLLDNNPSLLSEIRAHGGLIIGCSCLILIGTFRKNSSNDALLLSAAVYVSFGFSRLMSMLFDGIPSNTLIGATVVELLVGGLCMIVLIVVKTKRRAIEADKSTNNPQTVRGT